MSILPMPAWDPNEHRRLVIEGDKLRRLAADNFINLTVTESRHGYEGETYYETVVDWTAVVRLLELAK